MFDAGQIGAFVVACLALVAIPGPAVAFLVAKSVSEGRGVGVASAAGVAVGNLGHALLAAFGASAVFASSPMAFSGLKWAGAGYLIWIGIKSLTTKETSSEKNGRARSGSSVFLDGAMVGILNPKVALFLLAFLPQFAIPERGDMWVQLLALGVLFVLIGWAGDSCWALLSGTIGKRFAGGTKARKKAKVVSGIFYVVLGVILAFS